MTAEKMYNTTSLRSTFAQTLAAIGISIYSVNIGLIFGMPTIVIGDLKDKDSPLGMTESQASWFGSIYLITQPIGSLISGFLQDRLGRKRTLMIINVPQVTAWVILYFSTSTTHLIASVALLGLSIGFLEAPILSYIGETCQPRLRGIFSAFLAIFYNAGVMIESFVGAALPWRVMVLCNLIGPLVGLLSMAMLPESPAWLVTKGRVQDAEKAYQWLRGWAPLEAVKEEVNTLVSYVRDTQRPSIKLSEYKLVANSEGEKVSTVPRGKTNSTWDVLLEPDVLIVFRIIIIFFTATPFASMWAMRPFFIEILTDLDVPIRPHTVVATCGFLTMMGSIAMGALMKFLGKRMLTLLSMGISILCNTALGIYLLSGMHMPWIPVVLFCMSYFFGSIVVAIPWIFLPELFPLRARSVGTGFCAGYAYAVSFLVTKTYYNVVSWLDVSGACVLYSIVGLLGLVYLYFDLPETEGKTLEDIERNLSQRRTSRKKRSMRIETDIIKRDNEKGKGLQET